MNLDDVRRVVEGIRDLAWDDETAHSVEDALYRSLLQAIADGNCADARACAELALTTNDIDFSRWYA